MRAVEFNDNIKNGFVRWWSFRLSYVRLADTVYKNVSRLTIILCNSYVKQLAKSRPQISLQSLLDIE
jgi:hypothetical protein